MDKEIDVLGLGAVAVDELLFVAEYPGPDSKCRILRRERKAGGLAGMALLAAARMGARAAYAGTLGDDELSRFIVEALEAVSVSTQHLVRREGARPFHSTIIVDSATGSRTILADAAGV
ncbi:MAG: PfkB family carbohydrate kinase, partial [Spirochaetaceae bacterium]|nr:PfkB family carbohydrate kinase [Spirochaetaceae bacterium]